MLSGLVSSGWLGSYHVLRGAECVGTLLSISSEEDVNAEVEILPLELVPELRELFELDPPNEDPDEVELDAALLLKDRFDPAAAMGADTLLACAALGRGRAMVTG